MFVLPKFIGHRGVKGLAPENTLASFLKASELGFGWVEFDVMLAACGEPVIFHDHLLTRTTNAKGRIANKTYAELQALDAGSWFSPAFKQEPIPSLSSTIQCLAAQGLMANIEIKPHRGQEIITAEKVVAQLQEYWPTQLGLPLISSFSLSSLYTVRKLSNQLPLGILYNKLPRNWQKTAAELNSVSIHVNQQYVTPKQIKAIKQTGRLVLAYTVNDIQRAQVLFDWGIDAVFTDYPLGNRG
jgi:glycerophosphoryl diester phosphodiesterase